MADSMCAALNVGKHPRKLFVDDLKELRREDWS
jgi:hypothetical protein